MKAGNIIVLIMVVAAMTACAYPNDKGEDFTEDELSPPVDEMADEDRSAGSLWSESAKFYDMFTDQKARRVGDIVIVQVVENSSADKEATTEATRDSSIDDSVTNFLGLPLDRSSIFGYGLEPTIQTKSSSQFSGDGKTSRKGTLKAVVSARVTRVLPSGNFVIKGKKQIRVNDEAQYIMVSGIIRPEDIQWNNSVMSSNVADLKVDYYGSGILGDQQNKGFLARAIDKIWPF
ncbi:MAG: flagellar basal body L-ring protein FlgH [Desulfobacterota bacterium]|jgi:flagellar L-ring protein FlgH|nr:flagellar basal body L-ring protein FlgH [Thermodesulfobacteriota bacterium]